LRFIPSPGSPAQIGLGGGDGDGTAFIVLLRFSDLLASPGVYAGRPVVLPRLQQARVLVHESKNQEIEQCFATVAITGQVAGLMLKAGNAIANVMPPISLRNY
jgi:hypothetical protein